MLDAHCHILWGVDDGAQDFETALAMLDAAVVAGIDQMICTPHMRWDSFRKSLVRERFQTFSAEAEKRGVTARLGYECYYKTLRRKGLSTAGEYVLEGTNKLLLEFNTGGEVDPDWERSFYRLQSESGLELWLAHPERYTSVLKDFDLLYRMSEMGVKFQVSAGDLLGGLFNKTAKCAKRIVKEGLCAELVSDAHQPSDYDQYQKALAFLNQ